MRSLNRAATIPLTRGVPHLLQEQCLSHAGSVPLEDVGIAGSRAEKQKRQRIGKQYSKQEAKETEKRAQWGEQSTTHIISPCIWRRSVTPTLSS